MRNTTINIRLSVLIALIFAVFFNTALYAGEINLPKIYEKTFKNGLQLIVIEHHELPVVAFRMVFLTGAANDPKDKAGLANFTAELLRSGTTNRDANKISEDIDFTGGSLDVGASTDVTFASCQVLSRYFDTGLELLSDIILNPSFPEEEIERLKKQTIADITNSLDDPDHFVDVHYYKALFGHHPYAHPLNGTIATVETFTSHSVIDFYKKHYRPNNAILAVVGDIKYKDVKKKVSKAFKNWKRGTVPHKNIPIPPKPLDLAFYLYDKPDATQSSIKFGTIGAAHNNPDYFPMRLMNFILGATSTSRMWEVIRNQKGMTYGIYSFFDTYKTPGAYSVATNTNTDSTVACIKAALEEMKRMRDTDVTDEELTLAKNFYSGYYAFRFETPQQIASQILNTKIYEMPEDFISSYRTNLEATIIEDIRFAAQRYLDPENMIFVVVGKAEKLKSGLESIGKVYVKPFKSD